METREKILEKLSEAIRVREDGNLKESRQLFSELIKETSSLRNSQGLEDKNLYVRISSEWVIQLRLEGKSLFSEALKEARKIYDYSQANNLKNPRAVRGLSNTLMDMRNYEIAEGYLREMINLVPAGDSARAGDAMAHLAICFLRMGKVSKAQDTINEAISKIEADTGGSDSLEIAVWKSHAFIVLALILNSKGRVKEAIQYAKEALEMAKKEKAFQRVQDATKTIDYLESKLKLK